MWCVSPLKGWIIQRSAGLAESELDGEEGRETKWEKKKEKGKGRLGIGPLSRSPVGTNRSGKRAGFPALPTASISENLSPFSPFGPIVWEILSTAMRGSRDFTSGPFRDLLQAGKDRWADCWAAAPDPLFLVVAQSLYFIFSDAPLALTGKLKRCSGKILYTALLFAVHRINCLRSFVCPLQFAFVWRVYPSIHLYGETRTEDTRTNSNPITHIYSF